MHGQITKLLLSYKAIYTFDYPWSFLLQLLHKSQVYVGCPFGCWTIKPTCTILYTVQTCKYNKLYKILCKKVFSTNRYTCLYRRCIRYNISPVLKLFINFVVIIMCLVSHETHDEDVTLYWMSLFIEEKNEKKVLFGTAG